MMRSEAEIKSMGFASVGTGVLISDKASFYGISNIHLGNHVRIDDFCIISAGEGGVFIGNYIHIACYTSLIGGGRITLSDFTNLSSRVSIYSSNDDYSGTTMTNPMVPEHFKNVRHAPVHIGRHVIVGSGSVVLPGIVLGDGSAVGALSLVNADCEEFGIYAGTPAKRISNRSKNLLELEREFLKS
jgi:galactoside O-acetyltransferase